MSSPSVPNAVRNEQRTTEPNLKRPTFHKTTQPKAGPAEKKGDGMTKHAPNPNEKNETDPDIVDKYVDDTDDLNRDDSEDDEPYDETEEVDASESETDELDTNDDPTSSPEEDWDAMQDDEGEDDAEETDDEEDARESSDAPERKRREKPAIRELTPEEALVHPINPRSVSAILLHAMPMSDEERDYCIAEAQKVATFRPVEYAFLTKPLENDILALKEVTRESVNALAEKHGSFFGEVLWYIGRVRYPEIPLATEEWVSGKRIFEAYADAMYAYKEPAVILEDIRNLCVNYLKVIESSLPLRDMEKFRLFCTEIAELALAVKDFRTQMCVNALTIDHQTVVRSVLTLLMPKPPREALMQSPYFRISSRWRPSTQPDADVLERIRNALLMDVDRREVPSHG